MKGGDRPVAPELLAEPQEQRQAPAAGPGRPAGHVLAQLPATPAPPAQEQRLQHVLAAIPAAPAPGSLPPAQGRAVLEAIERRCGGGAGRGPDR